MARPTKEGLDYFPLDIDFDQDDKLIVPITKFGMQGLGIIIKLMSEIYRNGYFYPWSEREQYVFANRINVDINSINDVVNECISWGFFHEGLFNSHRVLTSKGFQKRYVEASKRRKETTFIHEFTLIDLAEACKRCSPIKEVNVNGNEVNVYINQVNANNGVTESTQSKEKVKRNRKGKGKKKEDKEDKCDPPSADAHDESYHADFESFWEVYPPKRKRDKAKSYATWKKKVKPEERKILITCTKLYAEDTEAIGLHGEYAKMPTTYLNGSTYKDYLEGASDGGYRGSETVGGGQTTFEEYDEFGPPPPEPPNYYRTTYGSSPPGAGTTSSSRERQEAPTDDDLFVRR